MTTAKSEATKTTKAKAKTTRKPAAKKATVRKRAAKKATAAKQSPIIAKFQEREKVAKEKLHRWWDKFHSFLWRTDWKMRVLYGLIILFLVAGTIHYFEIRIDENMAKNRHEAMLKEKALAEAKERVETKYLTATAKAERAERAQVVSYKTDGFTVIHNAKEDKLAVEYRNRLSEWAKAEGFDGIVFGRIQPMFEGGFKYATYSGMNEVPMDYVVDKLQANKCSKVISVMTNQTEFHLPHPFVYQTNGDFKVWQTSGLSAAGLFSIIDQKIKFQADNFEGTLHDGVLAVKLSDNKPWEMQVPEDIINN